MTWQGWLVTGLFIAAETALAVALRHPAWAVWAARAAVLVVFLGIAFATRDANRNV